MAHSFPDWLPENYLYIDVMAKKIAIMAGKALLGLALLYIALMAILVARDGIANGWLFHWSW